MVENLDKASLLATTGKEEFSDQHTPASTEYPMQ